MFSIKEFIVHCLVRSSYFIFRDLRDSANVSLRGLTVLPEHIRRVPHRIHDLYYTKYGLFFK